MFMTRNGTLVSILCLEKLKAHEKIFKLMLRNELKKGWNMKVEKTPSSSAPLFSSLKFTVAKYFDSWSSLITSARKTQNALAFECAHKARNGTWSVSLRPGTRFAIETLRETLRRHQPSAQLPAAQMVYGRVIGRKTRNYSPPFTTGNCLFSMCGLPKLTIFFSPFSLRVLPGLRR